MAEVQMALRFARKSSGNVPWMRKFYQAPKAYSILALKKEPKQLRLIVAYMARTKSIGLGYQIVDEMKTKGWIKTRIDSAALFAYYRKRMERYGVQHVG